MTDHVTLEGGKEQEQRGEGMSLFSTKCDGGKKRKENRKKKKSQPKVQFS